MGWTRCICCEMFDMTSQQKLFALITPVEPKFNRVSQSNETVPDAPKQYQTHQEFRVQWSRPGAFVVKMFHTTSWHELFSLTAPVLAQIAPSFVQLRNDPKCIQTLRYSPKLEFRVPWGGRGAFVAKMSDTTSWHELFSLIGAVQPKLHRVSYNIETIPNAPKHYETNQKKSLLSNGLDQVRSF